MKEDQGKWDSQETLEKRYVCVWLLCNPSPLITLPDHRKQLKEAEKPVQSINA